MPGAVRPSPAGRIPASGLRPPPSGSEPFPQEPRAGFISIGRILGAWGLRGGLKVESHTDFPERFAAGASVWLEGERRQIVSSRRQRGGVILTLSGIEDATAGARLRGALLELPESELHALEEDEYYEHDLIGLAVVTSSGEDLGRVAGLVPTGANAVLDVRGARGNYLLPMIVDVVQGIDLGSGRIIVDLLPGLEPAPSRAQRARPTRKPPR